MFAIIPQCVYPAPANRMKHYIWFASNTIWSGFHHAWNCIRTIVTLTEMVKFTQVSNV